MPYLRIAETDDIHFDHVDICNNKTASELEISGLVFHSAMVAEKIQLIQEDSGHTMRVLVEMALAHPGKSGSFDIKVKLSPSLDRVIFGTKGHLLWSHAAGNKRLPAAALSA